MEYFAAETEETGDATESSKRFKVFGYKKTLVLMADNGKFVSMDTLNVRELDLDFNTPSCSSCSITPMALFKPKAVGKKGKKPKSTSP